MTDLAGVWRYDTSQVIAAPASGYLRTNASPVTQMAISATTKGGLNVHADLVALTSGATLLVQEESAASNAAKWQLTAAVIDNTSWVQLAVAVVAYAPAVGPPRPNQDLLVTGFAAAVHGPYVSISELQRVLRIDTPTAAQTDAMNRVLNAAAEEIDWELDYTPDTPAPSPVPPVVSDVNLDRAVELWRLNWSPGFGAIPVGPDQVPVITARDSWYRHRLRLLPLKGSWGVG